MNQKYIYPLLQFCPRPHLCLHLYRGVFSSCGKKWAKNFADRITISMSKELTVESFPAVAKCKIVLPSLSAMLASFVMFRHSIRYLTASYWLFFTARWRTVSPEKVLISADSRLVDRISSMMFIRPLMAAKWSGVRPSLSCKEERSGSNFRSSLVVSRWPLLQERCNGVLPLKSFFHANSDRATRSSFTISAACRNNKLIAALNNSWTLLSSFLFKD